MPTVMICDDEPDLRKLWRLTLELEGWTVVEAGNGRDALDALDLLDDEPDCIVLDIMMPVMDGLAALLALRSDPVHSHVPVMILSAKAGSVDIDRGLRAGANDYCTKPFPPHKLVEVVSRLAGLNAAA